MKQTRIVGLIGTASFLLITGAPADGDLIDWLDEDGGVFNVGGNWDGGVVPGEDDTAVFNLPGSMFTVDFTADVTNQSLLINHGNITFDLGGNTYTLTGTSIIGAGAGDNASLLITNGTLANNGHAVIAQNPGSSGAVTVTGATSSWEINSFLVVGNSGTGTLIISDGGVVSNTSGFIGEDGTGHVTVTGDGSTWMNSQFLEIGAGGTGTLTISDGGMVSNSFAILGGLADALGEVLVTGAGSIWESSGALHVGDRGHGTLIISDGGKVFSTSGRVAQEPGSTGHVTVTGAGSTWIMTSNLQVGADGNEGTLIIDDGGVVTSVGQSIIGTNAPATGLVVVTGHGSLWDNDGRLCIGDDGDGTLIISDGGTVLSNDIAGLADQSGTTGEVIVTGNGSIWNHEGTLTVGDRGHGTLIISDGGTVSNASGTIGRVAGSTGHVTVTGDDALWFNDGDLVVGLNGDGTLLISDGGTVENTEGGVGVVFGSTGHVTVTGAGSLWENSSFLAIGDEGEGSLTVSDGGTVSNTDAFIGTAAGSTGMVTVTGPGSTWINSGDLFVGGGGVGPGGTGLLTISNGGRVTVGGDFTVFDTGSLALAFEYTADPDVTERVVVGGQAFLLGDAAIDMLKIDDEPIFTGDQRIVIETGEGIDVNEDELTITSNVLNPNVANNIEWLAAIIGDDLVMTANILDVNLADFAVGRNNIAAAQAIDSAVAASTFDETLKGNLMSLAHTTQLNDGLHALLPLQHHSAMLSSIRTTQMLNHGFAGEMASQRRGLGGLSGGLGMAANSGVGAIAGVPESGAQFAMLAHDPAVLTYALSAFDETDNDRWQDAAETQWGGFARGIGIFDSVDSGRDRIGHRANIGGIHVGIDNRIHRDWTVGLSGAYAFTDLTFRNRAGDGDIHTFRIGPYVSWTPERVDGLFVDGSITYGYHRNEIDRNVTLGMFDEVARSRYNAHDVSVFATAGYDFEVFERTTLTPMLGLQFTHLRRDSFTERGAPGANLGVSSESTDSLRTVLGAKVTHVMEVGDWTLVPEIYAGWAHEYLDRTTDITARFAGTADPFTTRGSNVGRNSAVVAGGVSALLTDNLSAFVRYEGDIQSSRTTHAVVAGIGFRF